MYRSIFYDYHSKTYFLDDDEKGRLEFQYRPTFYKRVSKQDENTLPILTGGWAVPTLKYDKDDTDLLEKDINKELVVLRDLYYKYEDIVPKNHKIIFLDIEIEMGGALTPDYIKAAPMPLTSISILNNDEKICFIVDSVGDIKGIKDTQRHIVSCKNEKILIKAFLDKLNEINPTIIVTWNGEFFDIPYLYYRLLNTVGVEEALRLSPIKKIQEQLYNPNSPIRLGGINHLDYLLLFKKYITKQESSYKLGDIGEKYVDLGKIEYEGNLNQLYKNNVETFIEYNIRDCEIMKKLDSKLKFIDLTIMLSHICNIPYDSIYYNTVMNEGAMLKYLKREGIVSPNKPTTHNPSRKNKEEGYSGGFLLDPIPNLYSDVIDLDFTSLYPSIIKSLNLGIETLVGRILSPNPNYEKDYSLEKLKEKDPTEQIIIQKLNKNNYTLKSTSIELGKVISFIEENQYTVSASGALFKTDEQSVCSKILQGWFEKREYYRGLKKTAGKAEDWVNYKLYDLFQHAFKILQNAMYGTYAINSWRYTDGHLICSAAITNSGQRLTMSTIDFVNDKINNEYLQLNKEELIKRFNLA